MRRLYIQLTIVFFVFHPTALDRIDGIAAVIGDEIILISELHAYTMIRLAGMGISADSVDLDTYNSKFLNELIDGKVLLVYGKKDSTISVSDDEVENATNNHISMLLRQNNMSIDSFEIELKRQQGISLSKFKSDAHRIIREQLLKQKVQQSYVSTYKLSRKDVELFYTEYQDSLPKMGESILLSKLSLSVAPTESVRQKAYEKIKSIKKSLDNGADFSELARSFSDGPEASEGGDLGFVVKGSLNDLVFEENVFKLSQGQISEPFETKLGFHIIKVIERRDQKAHIQQIFIKVEPPEELISLQINRIDSIRSSCKTQEDFINAVKKYSKDPVTQKSNGSLGWVSVFELPSEIKTAIDTLKIGEITPPITENQYVSIYRIDNRVPERKLTLEDDFPIIERKALDIISQKKLAELVSQWRKKIFIDVRI